MNRLIACVALLCAVSLPCQSASPGGSGGVTITSVGVDGVTLESTYTQGEPLPSISTTWTDCAGVTHSVSTPIVSTTPTGTARAVEQHHIIVLALQRAYPPRPVPPPVVGG